MAMDVPPNFSRGGLAWELPTGAKPASARRMTSFGVPMVLVPCLECEIYLGDGSKFGGDCEIYFGDGSNLEMAQFTWPVS